MEGIKLNLRPYQHEAIKAWETQRRLKGHTRQLVMMATGLGKTVTFWSLVHKHFDLEQHRIMVLAHTQELVRQAQQAALALIPEWKQQTYTSFNRPATGVCMNTYDEPHARIVIGTVQSVHSDARLKRILKHGKIDLLIIDEAHHAVAPTYRSVYKRLQKNNPDIQLLGVTATPERSDQLALKAMFDVLSFQYDIQRGVAEGWLKPLKGITVATPVKLAHVATSQSTSDFVREQLVKALDVQNWKEIVAKSYADKAAGRQAIAFMPSVEMSQDFALYMQREQGVPVAHLDADTIIDEHGKEPHHYGWTYDRLRREVLERYKRGDVQILTNFNILMEGFDAPATSCILWARPTLSNTVFTQGVGRGTRLPLGLARLLYDQENKRYITLARDGTWERIPEDEFPTFTDCLVLDFAAEDVSVIQMGSLFGKEVEQNASVDVLEHEAEEAEAQNETLDILAGVDLAALLKNDADYLYDVGSGQRYSVRSLFGSRKEAWYNHFDASQSVSAGKNNILFVSPPRFELVEKVENQVLRGRMYLENLPLDDPKRPQAEHALRQLEAKQEFFMGYTVWNCIGEERESSVGRPYTYWRKADLVGVYSNPQDAAYAAFPLAIELARGEELLTDKSKTWRSGPPSQGQLKALTAPNSVVQRALSAAGLRIDIPDPATKGEASQMIAHFIAMGLVTQAMRKIVKAETVTAIQEGIPA